MQEKKFSVNLFVFFRNFGVFFAMHSLKLSFDYTLLLQTFEREMSYKLKSDISSKTVRYLTFKGLPI